MSEISEAVRARYASLASQTTGSESCCEPEAGGCCPQYSAAELAQVGLAEALSLGCGNPTALAQLQPGETVLDLGSGAGLDVLLSARRVAPGGWAYGLDMTEEMLELASRNQQQSGVSNATFLRGTMESIPLPDAAVDVVISNCVINLAEDKGRVLEEAFRVLRPGGRLAVADIVEIEALAPATKRELDAWAGCIAGTIPVEDYRALLRNSGFEAVDIEVCDPRGLPGQPGLIASAHVRAQKPTPAPGR